jgi:uracil-DNA glycosylase
MDEEWMDFFGQVTLPDVPDNSFPPLELRYAAFRDLAPSQVRCVLLGQDPYHNNGQATGYAFTVNPGCKTPPSLRNLLKELEVDDLGTLAQEEQILLLNTALSVEPHKAGSHLKEWKNFTISLIEWLSGKYQGIAWILLGTKAHAYGKYIAHPEKHGIFKAGHPSPLNRTGSFLGSGVFKHAFKYAASQD